MIDRFNLYLQQQKFFKPTDTLLVAVSGGIDSMVLCGLLRDAGYVYAVAHCNFKLRGKESDGDEKFVKDYCKKKRISFFGKKFDTLEYAENKGISIQMAARELRYDWFTTLLKNHGFDYLLTAHHANDNIETFFINLLRGSGIKGLKAILPKKDKVVRPLLFATRVDIEAYAAKNKIVFREDSSNKEEKYLRNQLRLQVMPAFKKLNPSFEKTITREIEILQQTNLILQKEIEKQHKKLLIKETELFKISIAKLKKTPAAKLILFELISAFDFNSAQTDDIYNALDAQSGKVFTSNTHTVIKDRDFLLIKKKDEKMTADFLIEAGDTELKHPINLTISFVSGNIHTISSKDFSAQKAFLDADKLTFPLTVNKWQKGDKFRPLGMTGFKKVSDFFTSEKASLFDKQNQYIIRCKSDIIWLVGKRTDDRFKVTEATQKICIITC